MGARARTLDKIKWPANHHPRPPLPQIRDEAARNCAKTRHFPILELGRRGGGGGGGGGGRGGGVNFLSILSEIAVPYPLWKKCFTAFFTKNSSGISEYVCRLSVVFSVSYSIPVTFKYYRFKLNLPDLGWWNIPQNIQRTRESYTSVTTEKTTTLIAGFSLIFHVA